MIENPQLAQSFILLGVLRQERDRLLSKTKSIPSLHSQVDQMQYLLSQKLEKTKQQNNNRKRILHDLQEQLGDKLDRKKQAKEEAEIRILQLRKNMNSIRKMNVEGLQLKKQIEKDQHQIQELLEQTKKLDEKLKSQQTKINSLKTARSMLRQQTQIGKSRVKKLFQIYNQLRNRAADELSSSLSIQQQISQHTHELSSLEFQSESLNNKLYHTKIEIYKYQQQIEQKKLKIQNLYQTLQFLQKSDDPLHKDYQKLEKQIKSLQQNLQKSLLNCQQINGQLVTTSAQANNLERDNKLTAHKIQCVLMLTKRLHGFRDRLIMMRRNNLRKTGDQSNRTERGLLILSKRSRAQIGSQANISLNSQSQVRSKTDIESSECLKSYEHLK